jgi:hypothetical protein
MLKKTYLILLVLFSLNLPAQLTLLDEKFELPSTTGSITTTPGGDYYWIDNGACTSEWEVTTGIPLVTCSSCTGQIAGIAYGSNGCNLNATLVVGPFSPSGSCVDISFDYGYTTGTPTIGDDFFVGLYDNSGTLVSNLVTLTTSDVDGTYSQQVCGLTGGQNYTIRTRFRDSYNAWGAEVDNFLVTESCIAPTANFSIVDDCINSQFYINVNVTGFGDGSNVDITNNGGVASSNAVGIGTTQIGPFAAGSNITVIVDGTSYSGCTLTSSVLTESCIPPNPQDCTGGTSICDDVSFSGNSNGPGPIDDIDGTTGGCLGINENESSWYFFEALTGGKLEFAIKPQNGTDDYDFALWGPYPSGSTPASICPPTSAPLRCSFAAGAPNPATGTGLLTGAGDTSEGTGGDDIVDPIFPSSGDVYILLIDNYAATTSPFDMDMTLSNGLSLNCTPLPIELLKFNGIAQENSNLIEWSTIEEINNDYFVIESSYNGVLFKRIDMIKGAGNHSGLFEYNFVDENPGTGISYYRLKQVDYDGQFSYSNVISVKRSIGAEVSIFPNPTPKKVKLNFVSRDDENITVYVNNAYKNIYNQKFPIPKGNHIIELEFFSDLPQGYYVIQILDKNDNIIKTEKIIKYSN